MNQQRIGFCLRIKANTQITDKRGKLMKARRLLLRGKIGEAVNCRRRRKLWNVPVRLSGRRKADGDNVIVVSSENVSEILSSYRLRWQIETLFGCLKTRGFCLEATHLTETDRVSRLLSLLGLAFCWAILSGELADGSQAVETTEARTAGKIGISSWVGLFEAAVLPPDEQRRQAREKTTYLTFVLL